MYINYNTVHGKEYATVTSSVRKGGSVLKGEQIYLGRVIDKSRGIYKSRERGLFRYDLSTNTYSAVDPDFIEPKETRKTKYPRRAILSVSFGDTYVLDQFVRSNGFLNTIDATGFRSLDTLHALFAYYILSPHANSHAQDWFDLTYAKYLYPKAQLSSQRISDALADIGSEEAKRGFFKAYIGFLEKRPSADTDKPQMNGMTDGILIDSTGLPNAIQTPLTAVNNHSGVISEEIRLIYVVQQHTGMPLFYRYVNGNVIDVGTIVRTIAELKDNGVNTKFAILDAGYYTEVNADTLLDAHVSFISRLKSNFRVYKEVVEENLAGLECKENLIRYQRRLVYVKCVPCKIGKKHDKNAYAYLCKDLTTAHQLQKQLVERAADQDLRGDQIYDEMQKNGIFILISSRRIAVDKILPLYYTRDQIEKIFEVCKSDSKLLPLNVETEAAFRGHLMMTFLAAVTIRLMSDKLAGSGLTPETVFMNLHEQHALVYDNEFVTTEPPKAVNEAYKALNIECPITIPRTASDVD